jgi:hypothetical protein
MSAPTFFVPAATPEMQEMVFAELAEFALRRLVLTCRASQHLLVSVRWVVRYPKIVALTSGMSLFLSFASDLRGQTKEQVRNAFRDLRNDHIRYNCSHATLWLQQHRGVLRDQILTELYRTDDPQARDALLVVLFQTETFDPDERFARFVVQRLREEDTRVKNVFLGLPESEESPDLITLTGGAHHLAWVFIDRHYGLFEPLLKAEVGETTDIWEQWAIAWMFKKHNVLTANASLFTSDVLGRAAAALKNDAIKYNASEAVRLFLMLPKQSTPVVRAVLNSSDSQQRYLARAFLDALRGSKNAVGYLNAKLKLYIGLLPDSDKPEPESLDQVTEPYLDRDSYP